MPLRALLPAEDDRRASLARDRWRVLAHEQQHQQQQQVVAAAAGAGAGLEAAAAAAGPEAAEGDPSAAAAGESEAADEAPASQQPALPPRLYPEAELVVEPEEGGSDDDGAGRDEHVRSLVQQYRQAEEQVGLTASRQLCGRLLPAGSWLCGTAGAVAAEQQARVLRWLRAAACLGQHSLSPSVFAACFACSALPALPVPPALQGAEYTEEELPGSLVDELEERTNPEQRHFAAFQAQVGGCVWLGWACAVEGSASCAVPPVLPSMYCGQYCCW